MNSSRVYAVPSAASVSRSKGAVPVSTLPLASTGSVPAFAATAFSHATHEPCPIAPKIEMNV